MSMTETPENILWTLFKDNNKDTRPTSLFIQDKTWKFRYTQGQSVNTARMIQERLTSSGIFNPLLTPIYWIGHRVNLPYLHDYNEHFFSRL